MLLTSKSKFLKALSLFSSLSSQDLEALERMCHERRFKNDQFLFYEGDEAEGILIVKEGAVKILKQAISGKSIIIRLVCPEGFIGEVAMFTNTPYPVSAQGIGDVVVYEISKKNMLSFIQKYPGVIFKFIGVCVKRLKDAYAIIDGLGTKNLEQRIVLTLLNLAETIGKKQNGHLRLDVSISRQEIAEMVGSTQESVSRVMANMKREGILKSSSKKILIIAPDRLKELGEEEI